MESKRLLSLDAFRGFTIAAMILVNNPGNWGTVYAPLLHKPWNGITPTDLVFPFFLFIMGVSITLSFSKRMNESIPYPNFYRKIISRTLKIFFIGLLLNLLPYFNFTELRVAGVLQRIALVYLICSILFLKTNWKSQSIIGGSILLVYWLCMTLIPIPGNALPVLEPGNNLAAWIDSFLLPGRMWQETWDPEGIFSTFPAIVTGISGMLAGKLILSEISMERKIIWLFISGFTACIVGFIWSWFFPLNKNLWTSSYVLVTGGLATMIVASAIFLVDILNATRFARVGIIFGANAITLYVLADALAILLYQVEIGGDSLNNHFMQVFTSIGFGNNFSSLLFAILCVGINFIPALWLYKKRIFIKL
jgi:predicted acyltransferase